MNDNELKERLTELLKKLCNAGFTTAQGNAILSVIASAIDITIRSERSE